MSLGQEEEVMHACHLTWATTWATAGTYERCHIVALRALTATWQEALCGAGAVNPWTMVTPPHKSGALSCVTCAAILADPPVCAERLLVMGVAS